MEEQVRQETQEHQVRVLELENKGMALFLYLTHSTGENPESIFLLHFPLSAPVLIPITALCRVKVFVTLSVLALTQTEGISY